ncbi:hypothetical protein B0H10DRAFT_746130 [Mycena sp. CBHHK59/15]|nr:hypothetical protein B0H10DRAFT_746130 [Mycena sp. CBHHK59/15]
MEALFMFNMLIGDSVVIWRAWVLYQRTLWAIFVPCLMLTMSFIMFSQSLRLSTSLVSLVLAGAAKPRLPVEGVFATTLSLYPGLFPGDQCQLHSIDRLQSMDTPQGDEFVKHDRNSRRTSTEKIMSLLVESGFIYCFFWLTQLILFFDVSREKPVVYVYELFSGMGDQISGMYPTLIIVIVNLHQTIWEQSSIDITQGSVQWAGPSKRSEHTASTFTSQRRGIKTLQLGSDVENAEE